MKYYLLLILMIAGCAHREYRGTVNPSAINTRPTPTPGIPSPTPSVAVESQGFKIKIGVMRNYDSEMKAHFLKSFEAAKKTSATPCFKSCILDPSWVVVESGLVNWQEDTRGKNLSKQEIYDTLLNTEITINPVAYWKRAGAFKNPVYGYTNVNGSREIFINYYYVGTNKVEGSCGYHETSHEMGFSHWSQFEDTVPYKVNECTEKCYVE